MHQRADEGTQGSRALVGARHEAACRHSAACARHAQHAGRRRARVRRARGVVHANRMGDWPAHPNGRDTASSGVVFPYPGGAARGDGMPRGVTALSAPVNGWARRTGYASMMPATFTTDSACNNTGVRRWLGWRFGGNQPSGFLCSRYSLFASRVLAAPAAVSSGGAGPGGVAAGAGHTASGRGIPLLGGCRYA